MFCWVLPLAEMKTKVGVHAFHALFIKHGADLTIKNNKEETILEAAERKESDWQEVLRQAIQKATIDIHK